MLIKDYIIVLILVSLVIFSAGGFIYYFNKSYSNESINLSIIESGNKLKDVEKKTKSLSDLITEEEISPGGIANVIFGGIGTFFVIIFNFLSMPFRFISDVAFELGIPTEITTGIILIISISFIFAIISAILRKNI